VDERVGSNAEEVEPTKLSFSFKEFESVVPTKKKL